MSTRSRCFGRGWGGRGRIAALGLAVALALAGCAATPEDMAFVDSGAGAFAAGDTELAVEQLRRALMVNPDNGYALLALGAIYERSDREAEARTAYAEVAARYGAADAVALGVKATERAAFAALARERLARLGDTDTEKQAEAKKAETPDDSVANGTLRAIFVNLKRVTEDLRHLSATVVRRAEAKPPPAPMVLVPSTADGDAAGTAPAVVAAVSPPAPSKHVSGVRLHLASYRTAAKAGKGWDELVSAHADLLDGLGVSYVRVDLGAGMGVFYRVLAGPVASETAARKLCRRFKAQGAFCSLIFN